jgi:hypothetical protein
MPKPWISRSRAWALRSSPFYQFALCEQDGNTGIIPKGETFKPVQIQAM